MTEETITFPDSKLENTSTYRFNHVFNGFRELQNAFDKAYAPMIRNVINGENAMLVFGGLPITESMDFFTSMNGRIGIINQAAQLLLRSNTISSSSNNTTVTLSWYKIDSTGSENINDLLRMSSSLHSPDATGEHNHTKDSHLVLRELGKGRGMIVPGLWEVEVTKPQDVDAVIAHVQRMLPIAKHDGQSHSIIQLTVTPNDSYADDNNKKSKLKEDSADIGRLTFVLLSNVSSSPSTDAAAAATQHRHLELFPWVGQLEDILRWIDNKRPSPPFHKSRILLLLRDALCTRMTCGISLFLQPTVEALSDNTIWLQLLSHISSTNAERSSAINTLPVHSASASAPLLAASASNKSLTQEQTNLLQNSFMSKPSSVPSSNTPASSRSKPQFNSSTNGKTKSPGKSILKNRNQSSPQQQQSASQRGGKSPHQNRRQQQQQQPHSQSRSRQKYSNENDFLHQRDDMSGPFEEEPNYNYEDDVHSRDFDRHSHRGDRHPSHGGGGGGGGGVPPTPSLETIQQQQELYQHQLHYQRQFYAQQQQQGSVPPPRGPPPAHHQGQGLQQPQSQPPNQAQSQGQGQAHLLSPPPPPPHVHPSHPPQQQQQQQPQHAYQETLYDNSLLPPQSQNSHQHSLSHPHASQHQGSDENIRPRENYVPGHGSNGVGGGDDDESDRKDAETVEALLHSLQASRDEVDSLKKSLLLCQENLEFHKSGHETLKNAKEGLGRTLKPKDRERLKKALQELKDYEVYREVMEAAMSRMQNEIDKLEGESSTNKQMATHLEKELRKSKNITNKITRDTSDFEKSKVTLHERVSSAEKDARRLSRERDAAVLALSQYKAESARDEEDLKSSRRVKHKEVLELKKKLADVNMQLKMQADEVDTTAQLHTQDMKKLQTAHKKSLEMLMACQEENDLLRAAVADLEDKVATTEAATASSSRHKQSSETDKDRRFATTPSPLTNIFQSGRRGMDDSADSSRGGGGGGDGGPTQRDDHHGGGTTSDKGRKGEGKDRRKTIVFVDDYENGDIYIDESSVLTGDTESLNSNTVTPRVKSINYATTGPSSEEKEAEREDMM